MLLFINPFTSPPYKSVHVSAISSYPLRSRFSAYIPLFAAAIYFIKSYTASKEVSLMRKSCLGFLLLFVFGSLLMPVSAPAHPGIGVSITVAPPVIPVYTQPICPGPNYIWTPGYWAWGPAGYYWVPGAWVEPPYIGRALDPWLLGVLRRPLFLLSRLLGAAHRLLRRHQLWLWLRRLRLRGRLLARSRLLLQ